MHITLGIIGMYSRQPTQTQCASDGLIKFHAITPVGMAQECGWECALLTPTDN